MYDNIEDSPAPLEKTTTNHSIPEQDGKASTKNSEDPDPNCDLAELQEHFQQLQE